MYEITKEEIVEEYSISVKYLRERGIKGLHLKDHEVDQIFKSCHKIIELRKKQKRKINPPLSKTIIETTVHLIKYFVFFAVSFSITYVILNVHQPTSSIVLRNVQGLIYPGLKIWRFLSVPFVKKFPSLTNLYDESCLIENPFFYVKDMECWPCKNVHSVIDLSGYNNYSLYQSGIPYIVKTKQPEVTAETLQILYENNTELLNREAYQITSNNNMFTHIRDILKYDPQNEELSDTYITWRINRMGPGRVIRSVFPRPFIISEWSGQSTERYVEVAGPKAPPYPLPAMECSYIFVTQGSGERIIVLKPSKECTGHCRTVSVLLKTSHVLSYNWWYWRPYSIPVETATETSVSYISSYC